jgi:cell division transport system ATP-binding protein
VALREVSIQIDKGDFLFISGSSGAGKTTLLKIILGVETVTQGQLVVNGRNVTRIPPRELTRLRRETGFVFQDFKLLDNRTALENVALALQIRGLPPKEVRKRAYHSLRAVGLADKRDQKPLRLSGGEQQRVAIARALVNDPLILLADEPTGNLDAALSTEIMDQFLEIHQRGTTLLVATHNESLPAYCGKRQLVLDQGRLVEKG